MSNRARATAVMRDLVAGYGEYINGSDRAALEMRMRARSPAFPNWFISKPVVGPAVPADPAPEHLVATDLLIGELSNATPRAPDYLQSSETAALLRASRRDNAMTLSPPRIGIVRPLETVVSVVIPVWRPAVDLLPWNASYLLTLNTPPNETRWAYRGSVLATVYNTLDRCAWANGLTGTAALHDVTAAEAAALRPRQTTPVMLLASPGDYSAPPINGSFMQSVCVRGNSVRAITAAEWASSVQAAAMEESLTQAWLWQVGTRVWRLTLVPDVTHLAAEVARPLHPLGAAIGVAITAGVTLLVGGVAAWLGAADRSRQQREHELAVKEEARAAKDTLTSYVMHELRVPLNSLTLGLLDLLEDDDMPPHFQPLLRTLRSSADGMVTIVSDMLDLARMERGDIAMRLAPVEVASLLTEAVRRMAPFAADFGVVLTADSASLLPGLTIVADASRILQILTNLLSNAVKFSPHDGRGRVTLRVRQLACDPPTCPQLARAAAEAATAATAAAQRGRRRGSLLSPPRAAATRGRSANSAPGTARSAPPGSVISLTRLTSGGTTPGARSPVNVESPSPATCSAAGDGDAFALAHPAPTAAATAPTAAASEARTVTRVEVAPARHAVHLVFEVEDNGCGIPAHELGLLFKPFVQLTAGEAYKGRGTGLGLSITQRIAARHNGIMAVRSQEGVGSVFSLDLHAEVVVANESAVALLSIHSPPRSGLPADAAGSGEGVPLSPSSTAGVETRNPASPVSLVDADTRRWRSQHGAAAGTGISTGHMVPPAVHIPVGSDGGVADTMTEAFNLAPSSPALPSPVDSDCEASGGDDAGAGASSGRHAMGGGVGTSSMLYRMTSSRGEGGGSRMQGPLLAQLAPPAERRSVDIDRGGRGDVEFNSTRRLHVPDTARTGATAAGTVINVTVSMHESDAATTAAPLPRRRRSSASTSKGGGAATSPPVEVHLPVAITAPRTASEAAVPVAGQVSERGTPHVAITTATAHGAERHDGTPVATIEDAGCGGAATIMRPGLLLPPLPPLHRSAPAEDGSRGGELRRRTWLIVDDVETNAKLLVNCLRRRIAAAAPGTATATSGKPVCRDELVVALSGAAALREVDTRGLRGVDVVVTDKEMPGMNGHEVVRALRARGFGGVVVGCTGNAAPADRDAFVAAGADDVVFKPVDVDALLRLVTDLWRARESGAGGMGGVVSAVRV